MFLCIPFAACATSVPSSPVPEARMADSPALPTEVKTVSLFKNGLAFARREAILPAGAREVHLEPLPVPVHGTFWLAAGKNTDVEDGCGLYLRP